MKKLNTLKTQECQINETFPQTNLKNYQIHQSVYNFRVNLVSGIYLTYQENKLSLTQNIQARNQLKFNKYMLQNYKKLSQLLFHQETITSANLQKNYEEGIRIFFKRCKQKLIGLLQIFSNYVSFGVIEIIPDELKCITYFENGVERFLWLAAKEISVQKQQIDQKIVRLLNAQLDREYMLGNFSQSTKEYKQMTNLLKQEIQLNSKQDLKSQILKIKSKIKSWQFQSSNKNILSPRNNQDHYILHRSSLTKQKSNRSSQNFKQKSNSYRKSMNKQNYRCSLNSDKSTRRYKQILGTQINKVNNNSLTLYRSQSKSKINHNLSLNQLCPKKQEHIIEYLENLQKNPVNSLIPHLSLTFTKRVNKQKNKQEITKIRDIISKQFFTDSFKNDQSNPATLDSEKYQCKQLLTENLQSQLQPQTGFKRENDYFEEKDTNQQSDQFSQKQKIIEKKQKKQDKQNKIRKLFKIIDNKLEAKIDQVGQAVTIIRKFLKNSHLRYQFPLYLLYKKFLYLRATFLSTINSNQPPEEIFSNIESSDWQDFQSAQQYTKLIKRIQEQNEIINETLCKLHSKIKNKKQYENYKDVMQIIIEDIEIYEEFIRILFTQNAELIQKIIDQSKQRGQSQKIAQIYLRALILAVKDDILELAPKVQIIQNLNVIEKHKKTWQSTRIKQFLAEISKLFQLKYQK